MKKTKKENGVTINKKPLIDATAKHSITIMPAKENLSPEEIEKEIQQLNESIKRIREKYYAQNVALKRIQSRTMIDIYRAKKHQIFMQLKNAKIINRATKPSRNSP